MNTDFTIRIAHPADVLELKDISRLHSMFVHTDFQGKGIATILLNEIERYATATGIIRITSEVSLTARPFFEQRGYIVTEEQKRRANQLSLTNFWKAKNLRK